MFNEGGSADCRGAMSPTKLTSKPPDLQNDLQAPRNRLRVFRYVIILNFFFSMNLFADFYKFFKCRLFNKIQENLCEK